MKRALLFTAAIFAFTLPAVAFAAVPTVAINSDADGIVPATGDAAVRAYACFSEPVSGFDLSDIQVTNGSAGTLTASSAFPCAGVLYTFIVTANTTPATITVTIPAGAFQSISTSEANTATSTDSWSYDASLGSTFTALSGRTWYDASRDGVRSTAGSCSVAGDDCSPFTEADLAGMTITATPVLDAGGAADASRAASTSVSNATGSYFFYFGTVDIGRWRISETLPSGWIQTLPTTTDAFYDVTINDTNNDAFSITRENYASALSYDFGSYDPSLTAAQTPLAAPTATPNAGAYTSIQSIALATASSSATTTALYYAFAPDADPSCSPFLGTLFGGSISIASSTTLKAIACSDSATSTVASFAYVINLPPDAPTASPATTTAYTSAQDVTLFAESATATIYYTDDGGAPQCGISSLFSTSTPIHLTASTTLNAVACTSTGTSTVAVFAYDIVIPTPSPPPASGGGSGPISNIQPVNTPPSVGGGAVTLTAPSASADSGAVLGTQTENTPAQPAASYPASVPKPQTITSAPAADTIQAPGAPPAAEESTAAPGPVSEAAAAGFADALPSGYLIAALILAFLLASWALWSWFSGGFSH